MKQLDAPVSNNTLHGVNSFVQAFMIINCDERGSVGCGCDTVFETVVGARGLEGGRGR